MVYTGTVSIQTLRYILLRVGDKQQRHDQSINPYHLLSVFSYPVSTSSNTHPTPQQKSTSSSSPQTFLAAAPWL
jgi:hypothetical protein